MAPDDGHVDLIHRHSRGLEGKLVGTHHVEGSHADNLQGVQALLLVKRSHGRHHGIHRIHDESDDGVRAVFGAGLDDCLGNVSVDVHQVLSVLPRLPRHAGRHEDQRAPFQTLLRQVCHWPSIFAQRVGLDFARELQVRQVCGHPSCGHHGDVQVIDRHLLDQGMCCHEKSQLLTDASSTTAYTNLEASLLLRRFHQTLKAARCISHDGSCWLGTLEATKLKHHDSDY
mmetsp:Transcript_15154/g.24130  ORF Transcript_15154/g.24130 Transcript_15154/m.24130 type:complete len:228 (+) Transcript_15154:480-1163(+)